MLSISLILSSFVAGFLTVLAPCILPLLPVVIGGSLGSGGRRSPYIVIASLLVSAIVFTLIIYGTSQFLYIPNYVWKYISASLLLFVGLSFIYPSLWKKIPFVSKLAEGGSKGLGKGVSKNGFLGDVLVGASLGPVFTSCSPTYLIILATVLPSSFLNGVFYLLVYALGLGVVLLFIALLGQSLIEKLNVVADDSGKFKKIIGVILIVIAIFIFTGLEKQISIYLIDGGFYDFTQLEI